MNQTLPSALVVLHAFGNYSKGEIIEDPVVIKAILAGGKSSFVIATTLPGAVSTARQEN